MPNHSYIDVANHFIKLNNGRIEQMKLQKLLFMSQGWNLAVTGEPLMDEKFEAWDGGPVIRRLWNYIRDNGPLAVAPLDSPKVDAVSFSQAENDLLSHVWRKYKDYTGLELSEMTHEVGTPWSNTYFGKGRNSVIPTEEIRSHFRELALAGRQTA
jgi:uncharacterized phage-associated protein